MMIKSVFPKSLKVDVDSSNGTKIEKMILVFKITPFELRMTNSHNPEQDTCHQQSMCEQTPLRFHISLREVFTK